MAIGKLQIGECGCEQEVVVGQFAVCLTVKNCDGKRQCGNCGSRRLYRFDSPSVPPNSWACSTCGKVVWP